MIEIVCKGLSLIAQVKLRRWGVLVLQVVRLLGQIICSLIKRAKLQNREVAMSNILKPILLLIVLTSMFQFPIANLARFRTYWGGEHYRFHCNCTSILMKTSNKREIVNIAFSALNTVLNSAAYQTRKTVEFWSPKSRRLLWHDNILLNCSFLRHVLQ